MRAVGDARRILRIRQGWERSEGVESHRCVAKADWRDRADDGNVEKTDQARRRTLWLSFGMPSPESEDGSAQETDALTL
jgi:hypothetical protein